MSLVPPLLARRGKSTPVTSVKYAGRSPLQRQQDRILQRLNNPPVGLVTPDTDVDACKKAYSYDPHLDPQLVWAGKAEHTSFEVPTVSLHVHERIDPRTIVEAVRKKNGKGGPPLLRNAVTSSLAPPRLESKPPASTDRTCVQSMTSRRNW